MTMPHLMNCPHSETGWCLACVKEQWEELDRVNIECGTLQGLLEGVAESLEQVAKFILENLEEVK